MHEVAVTKALQKVYTLGCIPFHCLCSSLALEQANSCATTCARILALMCTTVAHVETTARARARPAVPTASAFELQVRGGEWRAEYGSLIDGSASVGTVHIRCLLIVCSPTQTAQRRPRACYLRPPAENIQSNLEHTPATGASQPPLLSSHWLASLICCTPWRLHRAPFFQIFFKVLYATLGCNLRDSVVLPVPACTTAHFYVTKTITAGVASYFLLL